MYSIKDCLLPGEEVLYKTNLDARNLDETPLSRLHSRAFFIVAFMQFGFSVYLLIGCLFSIDPLNVITFAPIANYWLAIATFLVAVAPLLFSKIHGYSYTYAERFRKDYFKDINFVRSKYTSLYFYWVGFSASYTVMLFAMYWLLTFFEYSNMPLEAFAHTNLSFVFLSAFIISAPLAVFFFIRLLFAPRIRKRNKSVYYVTDRRLILFNPKNGNFRFVSYADRLDYKVLDYANSIKIFPKHSESSIWNNTLYVCGLNEPSELMTAFGLAYKSYVESRK